MSRPNTFLFEVAPTTQGRIQLCRTGSFYRQDQGAFKVTKGMLEAMRDNAVERAVDIPIKLTHQGVTYAVGWVSPSSLSVRPWGSFHGLFGVPRWTDANVKASGQEGKLKYGSPEIMWNDRRMADSSRGKAGEPIGPTLCGIALVLDPFFTMDPVQFSKLTPLPSSHRRKAKEYSMLTQEQIDKLKALLTEKAKLDETAAGALVLEMMPIVCAEEVPAAAATDMAAADAPAEPKPEDQQSYSREIINELKGQLKSLKERIDKADKAKADETKKEADELYAQYDKEGRFAHAKDKPEERKAKVDKYGKQWLQDTYGWIEPIADKAAPEAPKDSKSTAEAPAAPPSPTAPKSNKPRMNDELDQKIQAYSRDNKVSYLEAVRHFAKS